MRGAGSIKKRDKKRDNRGGRAPSVKLCPDKLGGG